MPFAFVCPACHQKNYGYQQRPAGNQYFPSVQCKRCGASGIHWVESSELAGRLVAEDHVPLAKIAIGWEDSPIKYIDPGVATGSLEQSIVPRLAPYAALVAPYSQGERCKAFTPNVLAIQEGQCEGQCLHWIRRVLQGGREEYKVPVEKNGAIRTDQQQIKHQQKQHLIGAKAQTMLRAHQDSEKGFRAKIAEVDKRIAESFAKIGITKQGNFWSIPDGQRPTYEKVMAARKKFVDGLNEKGFYSYGWDELAKDLDKVMATTGGSKRPFSNILAVKCVHRRSSIFGNGSANSFAAAINAEAELQPGRAVLLSVGLGVGIGEAGGSISGHAIAVHCKSASEYYIFDPNLGVFRAGSRQKMQQALAVLMGQVWTLDLGWQLNGTFGYAVFRAQSKNESLKPSDKPVVYTAPSPKFVAVQNKALGTIPGTPKTTVVTSQPVTTGQKGKLNAGQPFAPQSAPKTFGVPKSPGNLVSQRMKQFSH